MSAQNPYELSTSDQAEIQTWARSKGLNAENQLTGARDMLISGKAANMDDLRRFATGGALPYSLTAENETEIRNWATGKGLDADTQVGSARGLLASGAATDFNGLKNLVAQRDTQAQIGAAKYTLTPEEASQIRAWAVGRGLNPDIQLEEANRLLVNGSARSLNDLKSIIQARDATAQANQPETNTVGGVTRYDPLTLSADTVKTAPVKTAGVVGYTPEDYIAGGYTPEGYTAGGYTADKRGYNTYNAKQGTAQKWDVTPEQTVEGRLEGLLTKGSPLLTLAETRSRQAMAGKGLLNSSMAEGEALRAMTETATPIATADAATFARASQFNTEQKNAMEQFNVREVNAAEAFNADSANQALSDNQRAENASREFLANAQNASKAFTAESRNQAAKFLADATNVASAAAAQAKNNAAAFKAQAENASNIQATADANAASRDANAAAIRLQELAISAQNEARRFEADAKNRSAENDKLIKADKDLADLNNAARNLSDTSGQAMTLYNSTSERIAELMANADLDTNAKQSAINQEKANLKTGLDFLESVTKVKGLSDLLKFSDTTASDTNKSSGSDTVVSTGSDTLGNYAYEWQEEAIRNGGR